MMQTTVWQNALLRLHEAGWDSDDIDWACDALAEACEEGSISGTEISALTLAEVDEILEMELPKREAQAIVALAEVRAAFGDDADALAMALYDLDAFASECDGDD